MADLLRKFLGDWLAEQRITYLAARAFWHGCLREDWSEEEFDAAIRQMHELREAR